MAGAFLTPGSTPDPGSYRPEPYSSHLPGEGCKEGPGASGGGWEGKTRTSPWESWGSAKAAGAWGVCHQLSLWWAHFAARVPRPRPRQAPVLSRVFPPARSPLRGPRRMFVSGGRAPAPGRRGVLGRGPRGLSRCLTPRALGGRIGPAVAVGEAGRTAVPSGETWLPRPRLAHAVACRPRCGEGRGAKPARRHLLPLRCAFLFLLVTLPVLLRLGSSRKTCRTRCRVSCTSGTYVLCTRRDRPMALSARWGKSTHFCGRVCPRLRFRCEEDAAGSSAFPGAGGATSTRSHGSSAQASSPFPPFP